MDIFRYHKIAGIECIGELNGIICNEVHQSGIVPIGTETEPICLRSEGVQKQVSEDPINSDLWMAHNADKTYAITP